MPESEHNTDDLAQYAVVHDPPVSLDRLEEYPAVEMHIARIDADNSLCGVSLAEEADRYQFGGRREEIIAGMDRRCNACVEALHEQPTATDSQEADV